MEKEEQKNLELSKKTEPAKEEVKTIKKRTLNEMSIKEIVYVAAKPRFLATCESSNKEEIFMREAGYAMQILKSNPYLEQIALQAKESLLDAIVNVSQSGLSLSPVLRLGYLIPRKGKIYFDASYMGKKEIVLRAGMVKDVDTELVYKNDTEFTIKLGSTPEIIHNPKPFEDRGEIVGGYSIAFMANGQKPFVTMSKKEIDAIMHRSEAVKAGKGSPWDTDYNEMAKKTIFNRIWKQLPKTGISESALKSLEASEGAEIEQALEPIEPKKDEFYEDAKIED